MNELSDRTLNDLRRWVELRVDEAKLSAVSGLSSVAGSAIGLVICLFLVNLALVCFTGVFIWLLHLLVHSWVWAAVIMGFIYLLVGALFVMYPAMFRNMMVRVFAPMFFHCKKYEDDCDDE
jgi:tetrahydromethanopterin S-methyltransferase subunit F